MPASRWPNDLVGPAAPADTTGCRAPSTIGDPARDANRRVAGHSAGFGRQQLPAHRPGLIDKRSGESTAGQGDGATGRTMREALEEAGIGPDDLRDES